MAFSRRENILMKCIFMYYSIENRQNCFFNEITNKYINNTVQNN